MFKTILFPTDFSEASDKAVKYIKQLKGAGAQEVIVLHVIDEKELLGLSKAPDLYIQVKGEIEKDIEKMTTAMESQLREAGFHVKLVVKTGKPFSDIMKTVDEEKVSVIVLGSHGRSNVSEMLMGSVSENVIRHAKVPVLVVSREV